MKVLLLHCTLQIKGGADAHVHLLEKLLPDYGVGTALIAISGESPEQIKLESLDNKLNGVFNGVDASADRIMEYCREQGITNIHVHSVTHTGIIKLLSVHYKTIRTLHNAALTCVSGEKYFVSENEPCNCKFGAGCLVRAYSKKCASTRRPGLLLKRFRKVANEKKWSEEMYASIISPSAYIRDLCINEGIAVSKIDRIPYPYVGVTQESKINATSNTVNLLFSGRITHVKGVTYLPEIVFPVLRKFPNAVFHIAGEGPLKAELEQKVTNDIKQQVIFHGWLQQQQVQHLYQQSDVFIIPSIYPDNFPIVCLEALHYGKPVLVNDVGGLAEMVSQGVNGFIFKKGDIAGMRAELTRLTGDAVLRKKMGDEGRKIFEEHYTADQVIPRIIEKYQL